MVQPRAVLVDILRKRVHRREIVRRRKSGCWGWERTAVQDPSRDGIDPARRNNIAEKGGSAPLRIAHRHSGGGKITLTESLCRNRLQTREDLPAPAAFIRHKEETAIAYQRPPCGRAELITVKRRFRRRILFIEKITSIQLVVSQKFPRRRVQSVCSGFRVHDHLCASSSPIRRRIGIGQNFEFLNGIENRAKCEIVDSRIVVVDTVE